MVFFTEASAVVYIEHFVRFETRIFINFSQIHQFSLIFQAFHSNRKKTGITLEKKT